MSVFPVLSTGAVLQYSSGRKSTYSTTVTRFLDGSEQRYRELKQPVRRWLVRLNQLTGSEIGAIETFFEDMQGQFGSFAFTDPWDEQEYPDCSFDQEEFVASARNEIWNQGYLVIRNNKL